MGTRRQKNDKRKIEFDDNRDRIIKNVQDYLEAIEDINDRFRKEDENGIVVYRGEPVTYPTFAMPGIFREPYLKKDPYFERNLLEELKANKLTSGESYLEIAIDSQHGGFPSRLLDVSYNCLVALYFAVVSTPQKRDEERKKDGRVLIYKLNKAYCPKATNVKENYKTILDNPTDIRNSGVFSVNHKLVDHIKLNSRIIAQQGALIYFQGLTCEPIPEYMYEKLTIDRNSKTTIEKQLEQYFGINTSFIYPEIEHAVDKFKDKAIRIESMEYTLDNEIDLSIRSMKKIIDFKLKKLEEGAMDIDEQVKIIQAVEDSIKSFKYDIEECIYDLNKNEGINENKNFIKMLEKAIGEVVSYYSNHPNIFILDNNIEIDDSELKNLTDLSEYRG
ncbi:FRG domain-containing protein [Pseudobutyrivibrio ruminis]|uniref:FRG domain-containing protein n=1 Tax=Pseudobutyrivibrio ruminis DSM 9787 TaxID=1123011 RepID=A0A285RFM1_9FIRM|nr:FRG domain-containing protein [Pseudobutyrivibrio ruminis]SOB92528.1 FRG domain-containing protein [Pseudobutyrivibrio ruminis DSM 9787]